MADPEFLTDEQQHEQQLDEQQHIIESLEIQMQQQQAQFSRMKSAYLKLVEEKEKQERHGHIAGMERRMKELEDKKSFCAIM